MIDVERAADVHLEGGFGILVALEDPQGGQVEDAVDPLHGLFENVAMEDVAAVGKDAYPGVFQGGGKVVEAAAEEVVVDDDFGDVGFQQFIDDVAADQPRPAHDQKPFAGDVHTPPLFLEFWDSYRSRG